MSISVHERRSTRSPCPPRPTGEWRKGCRAWLVPRVVHEPVRGPAQNQRLFHVHQRSRRLSCHNRRENGQALHDGLALRKRLFLGSRRFVVSPDVRAIQKSHSECCSELFLNPFEPAFPYAEFRPADGKLCCPPPRTQFSKDTPPFRTILMAPENRCYRAPQIMGRRSCLVGEPPQSEVPRSPMSRP